MEYNEKKSVFSIFMAAPFVFIMVRMAESAVTGITGKWEGIFWEMLASLIDSVISCGMAAFYLNAVRKGIPDIADIYSFLTNKTSAVKFLAVMACKMIIETALSLIMVLFVMIPVVNIIAGIGTVLVSMLFLPVWYMFAANPDYDTSYYFVSAKNRMSSNFFEYLGVALLVIMVALFGVLIMGVMLPLFGILGVVLFLPALWAGSSIAGLIIADFMNKIIPANW